MPLQTLPTLNAVLNGVSAMFLLAGYLCIRNGKIGAHRILMGSALISSTLFLVSYLTYHYQAGSRHFAGTGSLRVIYFAILLTHTILAATIVPLVMVTVTRALQGNFPRHRRIARGTFPLWIYVSVTGVTVYWMLYHLF